MQTLSAYQMEIKPRTGQSTQDCVEEICTHFSTFVVNYYRRRKVELLPLAFDGRSQIPELGSRVVAAHFVCAQHSLATLDWEVVPPEDDHFTWRISCSAACDRQTVEVQYRVQVGPTTLLLPVGTSRMNTPQGVMIPVPLLVALLERWSATVDGWPIPLTPKLLQAPDVKAYVDQVLLNPRRMLPVILLAADGRFKAPPEFMQELQRWLLGAAHVAALMNSAATEQLSAELGRDLACSQGVLRIYAPLFTRESRPEHHRVFHAPDLEKKGKLEPILHREAMLKPVQRVPDGPITKAARAAVCMELSKHSAQMPALLANLASTEEKRQQAEAQRDRAQEDREKATQTVRSLKQKQAEHSTVLFKYADELLALKTKVETGAQEFAKLRAEHDATRALLLEKEKAVGDAQHHLDLLREHLQKNALSQPSRARELEEELQHAWQDNDQTLAELEVARQDLSAVQGELADCQANLELLLANPGGKRSTADELVPAIAQLPKTVLDALRFASQRCADVLEIWDDAWASAQKSTYPGPTRVLQALQAIAEVGRSYFAAVRAGQPPGPLDQAFRGKIPFKYARSETGMTMAMHGRERIFHGRQIERHLTLGGGGTCVQIYFDFDDDAQKVIIAHCGQHLTNYC